MADKSLPTIDRLRQRFLYDADSGKIIWQERQGHEKWNARYAGKEAGGVHNTLGYRYLSFDCKHHLAHRVAWALYYGEWPIGQIDHINHDRADNRISNLRVVNQADNLKNHRLSRANKSGVCGVWQNARGTRWLAYIMVNRKNIYLGSFPDREQAAKARKDAEEKYGFHPNHGAADL